MTATAPPDTRALARFLVALATGTIALLLAAVLLVGVTGPDGVPQTPAGATSR